MALMPSVFGRRGNIFDPFSLETLDPFEGILSGAVPSSLWSGGGSGGSDVDAVANTRIDWRETPEAHVFKADLPGLKKDEVRVEVAEGRVLQISGERKREEEKEEEKYHRLERSYGRFVRRFRLPENAKMDQIRASMENGVLCVCIPKEEKKQQPEVKAVEICGSC